MDEPRGITPIPIPSNGTPDPQHGVYSTQGIYQGMPWEYGMPFPPGMPVYYPGPYPPGYCYPPPHQGMPPYSFGHLPPGPPETRSDSSLHPDSTIKSEPDPNSTTRSTLKSETSAAEPDTSPEILYDKEELSTSHNFTDGWDVSEYCKSCFFLQDQQWSKCPNKYSNYLDKKKHAQKHADEKESSDWKRELRRCFPGSGDKERPLKLDGPKISKDQTLISDQEKVGIGRKRKRDDSDPESRMGESLRKVGRTEKTLQRPPSSLSKDFGESGSHHASRMEEERPLEIEKSNSSKENATTVLEGKSGSMHHEVRINQIVLQNTKSGILEPSCSLCSKSIHNSSSVLAIHVLSHVSEAEVFACGACSFKGKSIKAHWSRAHSSKNLTFAFCNSKVELELLTKMESCFGEPPEATKVSAKHQNTEEHPYMIRICEIVTKNKAGGNLAQCNLCGAQCTFNKYKMTNHILTHVEEVLYTCGSCSYEGSHIAMHILRKHGLSLDEGEFTDHRRKHSQHLMDKVEKCYGQKPGSPSGKEDLGNGNHCSQNDDGSSDRGKKSKAAGVLGTTTENAPSKTASHKLPVLFCEKRNKFIQVMKEKKVSIIRDFP